jgi:DNA-binding transcriptional MerR regulator
MKLMQKDGSPLSIRELSDVSGVNSVTLRAWERRYGLLKPQRTSKGHRYYLPDDVEKIRSVLRWLDRGVAISKVKLLLEDEAIVQQGSESAGDGDWKNIVSAILESASAFRCEKLSQQMQDVFLSYPLDTLANNFFPLLFDKMEKKHTLQLGAKAEKVFVETEISLRLQTQIHQQNANNQGERILLVVLGKDDRQYRSLIFSLALLEAGYRLHLLLESCDLREIPLMVEKAAIACVICYSDIRLKETLLEQELERCASYSKVPFFVAGHWLSMEPNMKKINNIIPLDASLRKSIATVQKVFKARSV